VDLVGDRIDKLSVEKRSDVYFAVNDDIGLKHRAHKRMEMKTRLLLSHGKEKWKKCKLSSSFSDDEKIAEKLKKLGVCDDEELKEITRKGRFCRVTISKSRVRFYINSDTLCEQTDVEITSVSDHFPGSKCNTKKWRTLCVEGSKSSVMKGVEYLSKSVPSTLQTSIVMGYPEFVMCIAFARKKMAIFNPSAAVRKI